MTAEPCRAGRRRFSDSAREVLEGTTHQITLCRALIEEIQSSYGIPENVLVPTDKVPKLATVEAVD